MKRLFYLLLGAALFTACNDNTETINVGNVEWKMVKVEAGEFTMGATSEQKDADFFKERPAHKVVLTKDYLIGETEVTQELWTAVMGNNPSLFKGAEGEKNLPVTNVTWDEVQTFIKKLNHMTGRHFRLPSEAEWEYAARGGKKGLLSPTVYSGADKPEVAAYYKQNSGNRPQPVGLLMPNQLQLRDMSGNVEEWVEDVYAEYKDSTFTDPVIRQIADSTKTVMVRDANWNGTVCHVVRGGHFLSNASDCRTTSRQFEAPDYKQTNLGFRLAE